VVCTFSSAFGSRKIATAEPGALCTFSDTSSWAITSTLSGTSSSVLPIRVERTVTESS
jgi:hypothetical protein